MWIELQSNLDTLAHQGYKLCIPPMLDCGMFVLVPSLINKNIYSQNGTSDPKFKLGITFLIIIQFQIH